MGHSWLFFRLLVATSILSPLVSSSALASEPALTPATALASLQRNLLAGPEVAGVIDALEGLRARAAERYPFLAPAMEATGLREKIHPDAFARDTLALVRRAGFDAGSDELRIAASWLVRGRLSIPELAGWDLRRLAKGGDPAWKRDDLDALDERLSRMRWATGLDRDAGGAGKVSGAGAGGGSPGDRRSLEEARRRSPIPGLPVSTFELTPQMVRLLAFALEDFLIAYGEAEPGQPLASLEPSALPSLMARSYRDPDAGSRLEFRDLAPDPRVVRGLEHLFRDLSGRVLGIDLDALDGAVAALPRDDASVIAIAGSSPVEALGWPFHAVATSLIQLAWERRMRIVWLTSEDDVRALFEDASIEELVLWGHGSLGGYGFEGLTGRPEEVISRLLRLVQCRAEEVVALVEKVRHGERTSADLLSLVVTSPELGLDLRRVSFRRSDAEEISGREGFRKKSRVILWACSIGAYEVPEPPEGWRQAVREELSSDPSIRGWLGQGYSAVTLVPITREEGSYPSFGPTFWPRRPSSQRMFEERFPAFLGRVSARLGKPLVVRPAADFLDLLADEVARFPGESWIHDFVANPLGVPWDRSRALGGEGPDKGPGRPR